MDIEKFIPDEKFDASKSNILGKTRKSIQKFFDRESPPYDREFYNSDRTRKFYFQEWRSGNGFRQFNIGLHYLIEDSWCEIMKAMTRWSNGEEQLFGLEVEALMDNGLFDLHWYDLNTGGLKRRVGQTANLKNKDVGINEVKKIAESLGFLKVEDLPEYIDFEKTATQFLLQAKRLDFSTPTLYTRAFLGKGK